MTNSTPGSMFLCLHCTHLPFSKIDEETMQRNAGLNNKFRPKAHGLKKIPRSGQYSIGLYITIAIYNHW